MAVSKKHNEKNNENTMMVCATKKSGLAFRRFSLVAIFPVVILPRVL
jgi:hypothetical protein